MNHQKVLLIIMDGWGITASESVSAIAQANTPFYDQIKTTAPYMLLHASGLPVGLPDGQMGNSEVGHMNIGAGRIVYQDLVRINREIKEELILDNPQFQALVDYCIQNDQPLHLMGLISDGGVHSHLNHLMGLIRILAKKGVKQVFLHGFMDGRDTSPNGGLGYIQQVEACMEEAGVGKVASLIGRYYAMDRDKRWPRIKKAYDLITQGDGQAFESASQAIQSAYDANTTDEFIEPAIITENGQPVAKLAAGNAVLFFNFRTDRGRQLTHVLTQEDMPAEGMHTLSLHYTTMTRYDESFEGIHVLYDKAKIVNGLGDYLISQGKKQIRIAETEKYPHVTFFFNGGREAPGEGESYLLCPSPKVATYDLAPEMSAFDICDKLIPEIEKQSADFICLNFANPDMVGHTGVFEAAVQACETVDGCTKAVAEAALENGYIVLITADHGNADIMRNSDGSAHTAHTTALVPLILLDSDQRFTFATEETGKLGDLAPTILTLMGLSIPEEMTGDILISQEKVG